jgi:hypothetical protein
LGLGLDEWQETVLQSGLGERSDGRFQIRQLACSTPRQNGKTMLIVARALAGLLLFDEQTIIVSAHRQDTARETFFRLVQLIEDNPSLEERVDFIARSEMREYIPLNRLGSRVLLRLFASGRGPDFGVGGLVGDFADDVGPPESAGVVVRHPAH